MYSLCTVDSQACLVQSCRFWEGVPRSAGDFFCGGRGGMDNVYDYCLVGERKERVDCCCFETTDVDIVIGFF